MRLQWRKRQGISTTLPRSLAYTLVLLLSIPVTMSKWALVGLAAFVIFTVGLNLGLHGIITLHDVPNGSSRYQMVGAPNGKVADSVGVQVLAHGSQSQSSSDLRVAKTDETKGPKVIKTKSKVSSTMAGEDHRKTSPAPPPKVVRDANDVV